jgi:DNA/RNA endonuclease G (NUC1)
MSFRRSALSAAACVAVALAACSDAPTGPLARSAPRAPSLVVVDGIDGPDLVISQVYGGGGNTGAPLRNDFIELFNRSSTAITASSVSVWYASSSGTSWARVATLSGSIAAGGYYLIQLGGGAAGVLLPTPNATGTTLMSASSGKVLLTTSTFTPPATACPTGVDVLDRVGYGGTNCGTTWLGNTATLTNTTAALRVNAGCRWTGNPSSDFTDGAPSPRNGASATTTCGSSGPVITALDIAPDGGTINVDATLSLVASALAGATPVPSSVTWVSRATSVAIVSPAGTVTGVGAGSAVVVATTPNGVADSVTVVVNAPPPPPPNEVFISQVYGGGGNSGAPFLNDYVELFNRGTTAVDLTGWAVQITGATGTTWQVTPLTGSIEPGRYYLVQQAAGANAAAPPLPSPQATGTVAMSSTAGKVVLTRTTTALAIACPVGGAVVDRVGYGTSSDAAACATEWGGRTATLSNTTAAFRVNDGCVNTGRGADDFTVLGPNPRNPASTRRDCTQPDRPQSAATIEISELMGDPANAESASWGEWFEVRNSGATSVDLQGWTIISGGTSQPNHVIASSVVVPAGGAVVLGRGGDPLRNGGVTLAYNYFTGSATTIWLEDRDFLMLVDGAGARVDSVAWTSLPRGVTKALRPGASRTANLDAEPWAFSTGTFGDGDYGSPGLINDPLGTVAPFVSPNRISISGRLQSDATLPVGFEDQLFASLRAPDNTTITTTFTWSSLTPAIASVDANGVIRALAEGTAVFRVTAADGTARNYALVMATASSSTSARYGLNAAFGEPADNTPGDDFIVRRREYVTSWNGPRGIPNWVAYNLNATQIVSGQDRCDCFTFDPAVEAGGFTRYTTADYTGAGTAAGFGIDRGHLVRSFDRTAGAQDNALTYYFSNIIPQASDNNQGPWSAFEIFLGDQARFADREVYIVAGASGAQGTVKGEGRITIPEWTWKVALLLPSGQGLDDVRRASDVVVRAVVMPNRPGIRDVPWESYEVTVDSLEALSGYDVLSLLPDPIEIAIESRTTAPTAEINGALTGFEGSPVGFSGDGSSDADGDALTYAWAFGDGSAGTGRDVLHTYVNDGTYTVQLIVTDARGLADTATSTITVTNVAPLVGPLERWVLFTGERYWTRFALSDVGTADMLTGTVDWGDGAAPQPLEIALPFGKLDHTYATPGSYTVTVRVTDGVATTESQVVLVVKPLIVGIEIVDEYLRWLGDNGQIPDGALTQLLAKAERVSALVRADDRINGRLAVIALIEELDTRIAAGEVGFWEGRSMQGLLRRMQWVLETP